MRLAEQVRQVTVHKSGSYRAPHKPLLLLMALARVQRGEPRLMPYELVEQKLSALLREFGPPRRNVRPEFPFWRLQNDGTFWDVPEREAVMAAGLSAAGDAKVTALRQAEAAGGFSESAYRQLRNNQDLVNQLAAEILEEHFPPSLHESILDAVGLPWVVTRLAGLKRSPDFRFEIGRLYEQRCAMCGFDGRLGPSHLALEAAHIQWHAHRGPDHPTNGLLLCSIHHQALDRGAMGLTDDRRIVVSQHLYGGDRVQELIIGLGGRELHAPIDPSVAPAAPYIQWHQREVFRSPARPSPSHPPGSEAT